MDFPSVERFKASSDFELKLVETMLGTALLLQKESLGFDQLIEKGTAKLIVQLGMKPHREATKAGVPTTLSLRRRSRADSRRPMVDLPAPIMPTSTTERVPSAEMISASWEVLALAGAPVSGI